MPIALKHNSNSKETINLTSMIHTPFFGNGKGGDLEVKVAASSDFKKSEGVSEVKKEFRSTSLICIIHTPFFGNSRDGDFMVKEVTSSGFFKPEGVCEVRILKPTTETKEAA